MTLGIGIRPQSGFLPNSAGVRGLSRTRGMASRLAVQAPPPDKALGG